MLWWSLTWLWVLREPLTFCLSGKNNWFSFNLILFFSFSCHKRQKVCLSLFTDYLLYVSAWNRICYMLYREEVCTATNIDNFVFCGNTFLRQIPLIRIHFRIYEMNPLSTREYRVQSELFRFDNSKKDTKRFQMILI